MDILTSSIVYPLLYNLDFVLQVATEIESMAFFIFFKDISDELTAIFFSKYE